MTAVYTLGGWVKSRRRELGLTQKELARQVGYALVTLRKVEAGELRLPPEEQAQFTRFARDQEQKHEGTLSGRGTPPTPPLQLTSFVGRNASFTNWRN